MKKIALLFICSIISFWASAQEISSVLFKGVDNLRLPAKHLMSNPHLKPLGGRASVASGERTSASYTADWYNLYNVTYNFGVTNAYYYDIYPDSNLYDDGSSTSIYSVSTHGLGVSFDPTDSNYYYYATYPTITNPITRDTNFVVDSFFVAGKYICNNPDTTVVDTVVIELILTELATPTSGSAPDSMAWSLRFNANSIFIPVTSDSTPRFADALYVGSENDVHDSIRTTVQRYKFAISNYTLNDTDASGDLLFQFKLATPLHVRGAAGGHLLSFVHFASGTSYALGTHTSEANYLHLYASEPNGSTTWFQQCAHNAATGYPGSYQDGLIATNQIRYDAAGFPYMGHNMLVPACAYASGSSPSYPPGFDVPYQVFHIKWPDPYSVTTNHNEDTVILMINPCHTIINGTPQVCVGSTTTLTDSTGSGTWSSANTSIATVSGGVVTGVSAGATAIQYTVTTSCGTITTSKTVTVGSPAGSIVGIDSICSGNMASLIDTPAGGSWSSSATTVANVSSAGMVHGVSAGTATITYTLTNACGTTSATANFTVVAAPSSPTITRTDSTLSVPGTYGSYQWEVDGTPIAGATSSTYKTDSNATYTVIVSNGSLCFDSSSIAVKTLGVNSVNNPAVFIHIYPNPTQNIVNIQAPVSVNAKVTSIDGSVWNALPNATSVDLSHYPDGTYFIEVYNHDGMKLKTERVVKIK
jgi:Secretion system C-terminal sorting domain